MSVIQISGSLAYDYIMNFPGLFREHFVHDKLHNINVSFGVDSHTRNFGGTAGNIAYNLALLGEKPTICAAAGEDFHPYKTHLERYGADTSAIKQSDTPTASAFIVTDQANNQISAFSHGAMAHAYGVPSVCDRAIIAPGNLVDMQTLPDHYRTAKIPFYFDPGQSIPALGAVGLKSGIEGSEAVFVNDYELAMITRATNWGESDIVHRAKLLVVTLGAEGSRLITKDGQTRVRAAKVRELQDPTGAGDAYRAGFLAGVIKGYASNTCAQLGSVVAAYCVETLGTQNHHFTKEDVSKRYFETYGETVLV